MAQAQPLQPGAQVSIPISHQRYIWNYTIPEESFVPDLSETMLEIVYWPGELGMQSSPHSYVPSANLHQALLGTKPSSRQWGQSSQ